MSRTVQQPSKDAGKQAERDQSARRSAHRRGSIGPSLLDEGAEKRNLCVKTSKSRRAKVAAAGSECSPRQMGFHSHRRFEFGAALVAAIQHIADLEETISELPLPSETCELLAHRCRYMSEAARLLISALTTASSSTRGVQARVVANRCATRRRDSPPSVRYPNRDRHEAMFLVPIARRFGPRSEVNGLRPCIARPPGQRPTRTLRNDNSTPLTRARRRRDAHAIRFQLRQDDNVVEKILEARRAAARNVCDTFNAQIEVIAQRVAQSSAANDRRVGAAEDA